MTKELQDAAGINHPMNNRDHDDSLSRRLRVDTSSPLDVRHHRLLKAAATAASPDAHADDGVPVVGQARVLEPTGALISDERNNNNNNASCTPRIRKGLIRRVYDAHVVSTSGTNTRAPATIALPPPTLSSRMTSGGSSNPVDDRNQDNEVSHAPSPQQVESNNDDLLLLPPLRGTHTLLANRIALKRQAAIQELINTEKTYVRDLGILVNHFFAAIELADCIQLTTKLDLVRNAHAILEFQRNFSAALQRASEVDDDGDEDEESVRDLRLTALCECFCDWADGFEVYIPYCIYQDKAASLHKQLIATNPAYAAILDRLYTVARSRDERRTFEDYMIMPVQRLLKYRLILETISKTVREYDNEHPLLAKALREMHLVALRLNTEKSGMEARKKTELFIDRIDTAWVQSPLKPFYRQLNPCTLIGTLDIRVISDNKDDKIRRLGCALFDTFMIMAKVKRIDKYEPRYWFPLHLFEIEDVLNPPIGTSGGLFYGWILRSRFKTFECMAMCEQEKQLWIQALRNAIQASHDLFNTRSTSPAGNNARNDVIFLHNLPSTSSTSPTDSNITATTTTNSSSKTSCPVRPGSAASARSVSSGYFSWRDPVHAESLASRMSSPPLSPTTPLTPPVLPTQSITASTTPAVAAAVSAASGGMRTHGSLSDLRDMVSDFRAHRRYHHQYSEVDARFVDVCTTPILMARAQHIYRDRHHITRDRSSRIAKSMSMVALSSFHHHHHPPTPLSRPGPQTANADARPSPMSPAPAAPAAAAGDNAPPHQLFPRKLSLPPSADGLYSTEETARRTSSPSSSSSSTTPPPPPAQISRSSSSSSVNRRRRSINARFTMDFSRPFSKVVGKFSNSAAAAGKSGGKTPLKSKRWASSDSRLDSSTTTRPTLEEGNEYDDDDDPSFVRTGHSDKTAFTRTDKMTSGDAGGATERSSSPSSSSSGSSFRHGTRKIFRV